MDLFCFGCTESSGPRIIWARQQALRLRTPVAVAFCLAPSFLGAPLRQYDFYLGGLEETGEYLRAANIPLILRSGEPAEEMLRLCGEIRPSLVVTDFNPLRIKNQRHHTLLEQILCPVHEVDSSNRLCPPGSHQTTGNSWPGPSGPGYTGISRNFDVNRYIRTWTPGQPSLFPVSGDF